MVKKKAILGISVVILVLLLAGCFLFKPPVNLFVALNNPGTPTAAKPVPFTWDATCTAKDASLTYVLHIEGPTTKTITTTSLNATASLEAGNYTAYVVMKANLGKEVKEAGSKKITFTVIESKIDFTTTVTAYATDTVTVSWEPVDGLAHTYAYTLDGGPAQTTTATFVTFTGLSEGNHVVAVKITDSKDYPNKFDFVVDMTGPYLIFSNSTRDEGMLLDFYGNADPQGRYGLLIWFPSEPLSALSVRFYRYNPDTGVRELLNLKDSNDDGIYDSWEVVTDEASHTWYPWNPEGAANYYYPSPYFVASDRKVILNFADGDKEGEGLFKLGTTYRLCFKTVDELGNVNDYNVAYILLNERYDNGEPVVELTSDTVNATPGGTFTITVKAPNVKEYVASAEHGLTTKDVSHNASLTYIQIPVVYSKDLTVSKVEMPNFMPGKEDLCATNDYQAVTPDATFRVLTIYRGFVNGTDETESPTDVLAKITFEVPSGYPTETQVSVQIGYEGLFAYYPDYYDIPNSIFRDSNDSPIDGIVTDLTPQSILVVSSTSEVQSVKEVSVKSMAIPKKVITPKRVPLKTERGER